MHPCPCWARLSHIIIQMNEDYLTAYVSYGKVVLPSYLSYSLNTWQEFSALRVAGSVRHRPTHTPTNDLSLDVQTYHIVLFLPSV